MTATGIAVRKAAQAPARWEYELASRVAARHGPVVAGEGLPAAFERFDHVPTIEGWLALPATGPAIVQAGGRDIRGVGAGGRGLPATHQPSILG